MTVAQKRTLNMHRAQSLGGVSSGVTSRSKIKSSSDDTMVPSTDVDGVENLVLATPHTPVARASSHDAPLPALGEDIAEDAVSLSDQGLSMEDPMESSISAASEDLSGDGVVVCDVRTDTDEDLSVVTDNAVIIVEKNDESLANAFLGP